MIFFVFVSMLVLLSLLMSAAWCRSSALFELLVFLVVLLLWLGCEFDCGGEYVGCDCCFIE